MSNQTNKINFNKAPKTIEEQIELLKSRGLIIQDEAKAKYLLQHISYYRLSGYWFAFYKNFETKQFQANTTFELVFHLYCFDQKLRKLLLSEIEKIEISLRSQISNYMINKKQDPFWFLNVSYFTNKDNYEQFVEVLKVDFKRSDEQFINSFKKKYSDELPPSWIILEITSFGTLSKIFKNINNYDKKQISNVYQLPEKVFESWLHSIVYIRNVCAHHTRLWNRNISIKPEKLKKPRLDWVNNEYNNKKIYSIVLVIQYLLKTIYPHSDFFERLKSLLEKYPDVEPKNIGFINDWENEPIWQK